MKYIDEAKIESLLDTGRKTGAKKLKEILIKAKSLKRLSLEETAALLAVEDPRGIEEIFKAAAEVKDIIYGRRVVLFVPVYISNLCVNSCLYCAFKSDNRLFKRKVLSIEEIKRQVKWLLLRGHKRILMVAGESFSGEKSGIDYYLESLAAVYSVKSGPHQIKRVNVNCAPLTVAEFKRLKSAGIGTYQLFQETYHERTYRYVHPKGPKSDPDNRIDAIDRAFTAGLDDVGIGVLYGLYDYKFDTLAMLMHIERLEKKFNLGPHTLSVPRIEAAYGSDFSSNVPYQVSDGEFRKLVAVLRLSVPYTGIILSTREAPQLRDQLFGLGVSQISAESRTSPGGYETDGSQKHDYAQFSLGDQRELDEVIASLIDKDFIPSFCAACYRNKRTGEAFMNLAKPGDIKDKCNVNALITLKEYLEDFASEKVKLSGYKLIDKIKPGLDRQSQDQLNRFFENIDRGVRDEYV